MMTQSDTPTGARRSLRDKIAVALLLLLFTLVVRAIGWGPSVINPDESIFSLAAREVVDGHLPYLTLFDNKPVGSTLILASAFALFGQSVLVARLVGVAFAWASGMLLAALARAGGFGRAEALVAGLVQIAYLSALGLGGQATLTESMLTPFTVLAALLMQRLVRTGSRRTRVLLALVAGLACGVAVLIKIVPILPGLAIAATSLLLAVLRGRTVGETGAAGEAGGVGLQGPPRTTLGEAVLLLAVFGAAALAPMLAAAGIYAANGAFDRFWWSNFGFARAYAAIHPSPATIAQRLGTTVDTIWPLLILSVAALLDMALTWRRSGEWRDRTGDLALVALAWLGAEVVTASASLQFFPHYFLTILAPLVILSAFGIRAIARWMDTVDAGRAALVLGALAALVAVERTQVDMARDRLATPDIPRRVAAAIKGAGGQTGGRAPTLFVTNYKLSGIYLLTGSPLPPTRFAVPAHLFSRQSGMTGADPQVEVAQVLAARPAFVVFDDAEPLPAWAQAAFARVSGEYRPFFTQGTVRVLRRATGRSV